MNEEAFKAWIKDCQEKLDALAKATDETASNFKYGLIAEKLLTPWYHWLGDWNEKALLQQSTSSAGPGPEAGKKAEANVSSPPKCKSCGKEFQPRFKGAATCLACWKKEHPRR